MQTLTALENALSELGFNLSEVLISRPQCRFPDEYLYLYAKTTDSLVQFVERMNQLVQLINSIDQSTSLIVLHTPEGVFHEFPVEAIIRSREYQESIHGRHQLVQSES